MSSNSESVGMPWEKVIDKDVKSSDKEDLGKVQSIGPYYIEVKEGSVLKKRYFIPKNYVQGYDGEKLLIALTKDEIKSKYERDSPPSESEFRTQEESEYKSKTESTPQYLHAVPFMAKEPGVSLENKQSGEALNISWEEVLHKHVRTPDNVDIGDVEKVGNEFIVVREGVANIHLYYIPKAYISNYDGSYLYISTPSGLVSAKFERDTEPTPEEIRALSREAPGASSAEEQGVTSTFEEGAPGTETGRKDDSLKEYREKEPMTPAKIKEHEPTAVKREMTEKIVEPGKQGTDTKEAAELARKKGMAKGLAGTSETGSEFEQGSSVGTDK